MEILPDVIIQMILSFDEYCIEYRFVSKVFKNASDKNNRMKLKQRKQTINDDHEANIHIKNTYFVDGVDAEYWIIDKKRTQLKDKEITLGYKGPINNIMDAIENCKSGDTLLIYDGKYKIKHKFVGAISQLNKISFIGMGANVIFEQIPVLIFEENNNHSTIFVKNDVYFKNIRFDCEDTGQLGLICVVDNGNLWMENCKMSFTGCPFDRYCNGIVMHESMGKKQSIYLKHCEFEDLLCAVSIFAGITGATILGCKFTNCGFMEDGYGTPTIAVQTWEDESSIFKSKIRIIGNEVFDDDIGKWIAFCHNQKFNDWFSEFGSRFIYEIKNNSIKGTNAIFTNVNNKPEKRNPNKIYLMTYF